jgi:hypothetical protein
VGAGTSTISFNGSKESPAGKAKDDDVGLNQGLYTIVYICGLLTTTIAVKESTVERLKRIMKERDANSLDQTINLLIEDVEGVPKSMFGADKGKRLSLKRKEHEEFQG